MKTLLTLLLATSVLANSAHARPPERGANFEDRLSRMQQHLELSDEQVEQIRENHANGGGREGMQAILSDEQLQKLKQAHEQRRSRTGGRPEADTGS